MSRAIDLTGGVFGRLRVIARSGSTKRGQARWLAECECGQQKVIIGHEMTSGHTVSCGCKRKYRGNPTHGGSKEPAYQIWLGIQKRCDVPTATGYHRYGGRGIRVADEWRGAEGYRRFAEHIGPRPSTRHSVDRINNDGNYEPGNVRWATAKEQARNSSVFRDGLVHMTKPFLLAEVRRLRGLCAEAVREWDDDAEGRVSGDLIDRMREASR